MKTDKIVIIGARGNLGKQLMDAFSDVHPVGWDKEDIDITKEGLIVERIRSEKPSLIINASAYNAVDACESPEEFKAAQSVNGLAPGYLARAAAGIGADFVHYSSDYVFDGSNKKGYEENAATGPISNYGRTKLMGEQETVKNTERYFIIRTSKLFGPIGETVGAKKSFIDIMLDLAGQKEELDVVDEEVSCFTYTPDLAGATRKLLEDRAVDHNKKAGYGIYHIVNENPCTWYGCAVKLFEIAGKNVKVNPVPASKFPRPAKRPAYSVLLNTKLPRLRNWEDAVREYLAKRQG